MSHKITSLHTRSHNAASRRTTTISTLAASIETIASLCSSRILSVLDDGSLRAAFEIGELRHYATGEVFSMNAGRAAEVYFVLKGAFRVSKMTIDGRYVTIRSAGPGDQFGDIAALGVNASSWQQVNFAYCTKASVCFVLPADAFCTLVSKEPAFAAAVLREFADEAMHRGDRLYELAMLDVRSRLLSELVRLAQRAPFQGAYVRIEPAPTHDALASQVCASREGVTRHLQEFVRCGWLRIPRRGIIDILDLVALKAALATQCGAHKPAASNKNVQAIGQ